MQKESFFNFYKMIVRKMNEVIEYEGPVDTMLWILKLDLDQYTEDGDLTEIQFEIDKFQVALKGWREKADRSKEDAQTILTRFIFKLECFGIEEYNMFNQAEIIPNDIYKKIEALRRSISKSDNDADMVKLYERFRFLPFELESAPDSKVEDLGIQLSDSLAYMGTIDSITKTALLNYLANYELELRRSFPYVR